MIFTHCVYYLKMKPYFTKYLKQRDSIETFQDFISLFTDVYASLVTYFLSPPSPFRNFASCIGSCKQKIGDIQGSVGKMQRVRFTRENLEKIMRWEIFYGCTNSLTLNCFLKCTVVCWTPAILKVQTQVHILYYTATETEMKRI